MFHPKVIEATLARWAQKPGNFEPEYHSVLEAERGTAHLNSLVEREESGALRSVRDPERDWRETLEPDELRFIRNERILCRADFAYFVSRYGYIKSDEDRVVRMEPWISQQIFLSILSEMQQEEMALMLIVLKARQLGLSRIISLILLHAVLFVAHTNAFLASSTEDKTGLLFDMLDFVLERLPFWMRPAEKYRRENKILELMNGSALTLQHGQQSTGIARGTTPTKAHISELSEFDEYKVSDLIDSALLRAMHDSPQTFLVLESTAKGMNNWWHDKWKSAKAGWPERRSRLRPLFLPWFVGGLYPKQHWLRAHPVPADYSVRMLPWAAAHAEGAEQYVRKTEYLYARLGHDWQMPLEQIWYYECERDAAIRERRLNKFLQEMPANDDEAFQSTNISVFDSETLTFYRENAHRGELAGAYGLVGPAEVVNPRLQPPELLRNPHLPPISVQCDRVTGQNLQLDLVPLRFDGWPLESGVDKIYIWEMPVEGETYGIGMDTSDGIEKDRTVLEGLRKGSINGPTKQVFEYASGKMNALDSWPFALALGTLYSVPDAHGQVQQPRMAIECKGHGDMAQNIIRQMGWTNFHPWNDKQLDSRQPKLNNYNKIGVYTTSWFRDGMIEMLVKMLRDGDIEISSPFFVQEMASLQGDQFVQSLKAGYGGFDDRIMALGFILVSLYKWDRDYFRSAKIAAYSGRSPVGRKPAPRQYAKWAYSFQERNDSGIYLPREY
jgi:hypothetical protein